MGKSKVRKKQGATPKQRRGGRVVLFTLATSKTYLEIQRPYVERLLADHPELEYHLWDASADEIDAAYVRELAGSSPQIRRFDVTERGIADAYRHYASQGARSDDLFVKIDETVLFVEADRFGTFLDAVRQHSRAVVSAAVVNNGLCCLALDGIGELAISEGLITPTSSAEMWWDLNTNVDFLVLAHEYFAERMQRLVGQDLVITNLPRSRFALNLVGFSGLLLQQFAHALRDPSNPSEEDVVGGNVDIVILGGFLAALVHTPEQLAALPAGGEDPLLALYREASDVYFGAVPA